MYVSHLVYQFETYMNRFLDLEYTNFDPKYGFLSSIEAEIISVVLKKADIFILGILHPSFDYFRVAPHPNLINRTLKLTPAGK